MAATLGLSMTDILAVQELIWEIKPELIIETGIARGGSLIFYASLMELLGGNGCVIGVDVDIRAHNREAIENHPMFRRITMIEGSSVDPGVVSGIRDMAAGKSPVMVLLDSNHTHEHVMRELELYSPFVTPGSCLVVYDTVIADMPDDAFLDRPWGPDNNPKTAVREFLAISKDFFVDENIEKKLAITVCPGGFLRRR
jgi:cephalosporin hydroxylase